ncbi:MAG TPA: molybdopterin-dependent oxidoreductase [Anaerolineae bacterium]|nr:molybdopterin-dependent oxidoreductase [Anaerolineae bacterium]HQI84648.1 molybdopterin-dependent oxidoreductase [Anaerolineae bacterium]
MKYNIVGQSIPRIDARAKVTGEAPYPGDFVMDGMLHMKLLFAGRPHARILRIDTKTAEALPGVVAVFTAKDVPVNEYGLQYPDQPVLCGPGSDKPGADVVRFVGDQVAAVVAQTEEIAARAVELLAVEYEDLPVISDPRAALKPDAPRLHPPYPGIAIHPELVFDGNIASRHRINHGDVDAALEQAAVVIEAEYEIPGQEHAYLQPEAGLAYIDEEDRVTVVVAGQWAHEDRAQIAHALALPEERVRVIYPAIGGAFGGREDMSVQIVLALAALALHQPVKIVWSRRESILGHHKRHRAFARARWAAAEDGTLLAAETEVIADAGAYVYTTNKVMGNLLLTVNGPYRIPNVKTEVLGVYTNNIPGGAFRGFGAPQGNFIAESQMNKLAEALRIDPVELRLRNLVRSGEPMPWGRPLPDDARGLEQALIAVAETLGWERTPGGWQAPTTEPGHGIGIALGFKNIGYSFGYQENAWAGVELRGDAEIEEAIVYAASSDVGQGTRTVICQMAAEALALPFEKVRLEAADTAITGSAGSCSASRMTFMIGNAVHGAAAAALEKWRAEERPAKAEYTYLAPKTTQIDAQTGSGDPNFAYGYVAIAAEVAVDALTGEYTYPMIACANDVGQAINPRLLEGQIEGGVVQALGWSTTEHFIERDGYPLTSTLSTYLIPTIEDIPQRLVPLIIENAAPHGPWGARGMAEMPFIAVAAAIHHALRNATGVWYNRFPFTVERVLRGVRGSE